MKTNTAMHCPLGRVYVSMLKKINTTFFNNFLINLQSIESLGLLNLFFLGFHQWFLAPFVYAHKIQIKNHWLICMLYSQSIENNLPP